MNIYYDKESAEQRLGQLYAARRVSSGELPVLAYMQETEDWQSSLDVTEIGHSLRAVVGTVGGQEQLFQELVFTIQGVICHDRLPPITKKSSLNAKPAFASQGVNITGFDLPEFRAAVNTIQALETFFVRQNLQKSDVNSKIIGDYREWKYLKLSNRLFTRRPRDGDTPDDEVILSKDVDPVGRLEQLKGTEWYHSEDNSVRYLQVEAVQGNYVYQACSPSKFRPGDIVEAEVSVVAWRGRDTYTLTAVLRGLTLFDGSYTDEAMRRGREQIRQNPPAKLTRKRAWVDNEDDEMAEAVKRMRV